MTTETNTTQNMATELIPALMWDAKFRTARKQHKCRTVTKWNKKAVPSDHTPMIEPGDRYLEDLSESMGYGQSGVDRYCMACAREAMQP